MASSYGGSFLLLQLLHYVYRLWWQFFCYYNNGIMATDYGGSSVVTTNMKLWLQVMVAVISLLQLLNYGYRLLQL